APLPRTFFPKTALRPRLPPTRTTDVPPAASPTAARRCRSRLALRRATCFHEDSPVGFYPGWTAFSHFPHSPIVSSCRILLTRRDRYFTGGSNPCAARFRAKRVPHPHHHFGFRRQREHFGMKHFRAVCRERVRFVVTQFVQELRFRSFLWIRRINAVH